MGMPQQRRARIGAGAILALVFGGGVVVGFALDRGVAQASPDRPPASEPVVAAPPPNDWIIDRLEMSSEQRARVDSVVALFGDHMSEIQRDYRPRFQAVVDSANVALRAILTPEQRIQYDSLEALLERRRSRNNTGRR